MERKREWKNILDFEGIKEIGFITTRKDKSFDAITFLEYDSQCHKAIQRFYQNSDLVESKVEIESNSTIPQIILSWSSKIKNN